MLIYSPYLFLDRMYDAMIIGVGAHWSQYLLINYKVYFHNQEFNFYKKSSLFFIFLFNDNEFNNLQISYEFRYFKNIVLLILTIHMFHFYIDAFVGDFLKKK